MNYRTTDSEGRPIIVSGVPHVPSANEVETFSGQFVDTRYPDPATIKIEDIAHALSNTCRYGGHCMRFYSVAEHAVFVSKRLERKGFSRRIQMAGLHHDDSEAYLGDIPRPLKPLLGAGYKRLTDRMDKVIAQALGLDAELFHDSDVKNADNFALFVEARFLLPSQGKHWFDGDQGAALWGLEQQPKRIVTPDYWFGGVTPAAARSLYIKRHKEITTP